MLRRRRMERREDELVKFIDFFAGIGGIRLGLERAGHECIGFCEFDKFARQSYKAIHNTQNEWEAHDVRTVNSTDVPKADLWCFGFPCQDLSVAGKQKGLQAGERSGLFYEIMRLLAGLQKEDRPKYLLVENVKNLLSIGGGFDFLRLLVEMGGLGYDVEWQVLNSKDFGVPQNRERVFLVGHLGTASGREVFPLRRTDGENPVGLSQIGRLADGSVDNPQTYRVYDKEGIAPTLNCMEGGNRQPMIIDAIYNNREPRVTEFAPTLRADRQGLCVGGDIKLLGNYMPSGHSAGRVVDPNGIAPTVMDNHGLASAIAIEPNVFDVYNNKMRTDGCTGTLTTNGNTSVTKCGTFGVFQGTRIRKLTPRECWRLQGFPDDYFDRAVAAGVSNSQLYKQAGNAVTVNVAEAIGRRLREIEVSEGEREKNQAL